MRRGELWRYDPVISRAGQSITRLVISSDVLNRNDALPAVYVMQVVDTDPGSLLAVRIGNHGWALATGIDRPVRKRLTERLGEATTQEMEQIDNAIRAIFDV